jgi:hypothetical protein
VAALIYLRTDPPVCVMPGLDPGIHRAASTMDPRIKSAGDA